MLRFWMVLCGCISGDDVGFVMIIVFGIGMVMIVLMFVLFVYVV